MLSLIQKTFAQGLGQDPTPPPSVLDIKVPGTLPSDLCTLLDRISTFLIAVSIPIAGLMILWAAYQILTAGGDPAKFDRGKKTILYTIIGLVVILLSKGLVTIIKALLGYTGSIVCTP